MLHLKQVKSTLLYRSPNPCLLLLSFAAFLPLLTIELVKILGPLSSLSRFERSMCLLLSLVIRYNTVILGNCIN